MATLISSADPQFGGSSPDRRVFVEPDGGSLRHLLIGEPALVRDTIQQIHLGHYRVDLRLWSPLLTIPETGLVIPRYPDQVLAFLQQPKHFTPPSRH